MKFIKSERGNKLFILDGFKHSFAQESKSGKVRRRGAAKTYSDSTNLMMGTYINVLSPFFVLLP